MPCLDAHGDEVKAAGARVVHVDQRVADTADHARTVGARHMGLDALDDFVTGFDAYAGFLICFWHIKPFSGSVFFLG